jgi:NADH:ubiquinone oxidoreductase subunit 5 (subunit L)/multisubunit Na+/H+ antiporter MnhA subunit
MRATMEQQHAESSPRDPLLRSFDEGRHYAFAVAALVLAGLSFLNLFGIEKAIVGIAFGVLAARGQPAASFQRLTGIAAVILSVIYILLTIALFVFFGEELNTMVQRLRQSS